MQYVLGKTLWLLIMDIQIHILNSILDNVKFEVGQTSGFVIFKPYISMLICRSNEGNTVNPMKYY